MSLLQKIKKAREFEVEFEGTRFTLTRPTDLDALHMKYDSVEEAVLDIPKYVVGWSVQEIDLIPGGSAIAVPTDNEIVAEYLSDKPGLWMPLIEALRDAYKAHSDKREARVKN